MDPASCSPESISKDFRGNMLSLGGGRSPPGSGQLGLQNDGRHYNMEHVIHANVSMKSSICSGRKDKTPRNRTNGSRMTGTREIS
ncbi:uncharacterized protein PHALS_13567 [Plasmopara halstedii]|uniref:Uncharacterized protein n=1 Tax=Plasmopara halstedii TaxID=4781 RepID=A0A0P1AQL9_PLAHL|nr:uncharacterized protein PHALS_13567 [Plasmopara halstedii]CEG43367.1 hypothetical protein PHALS_13567 [Plasmopara halstedii]|eukprot:XP_024579736.1 hypothetical protein PHALS_13567 [Plasmopara halstedii]